MKRLTDQALERLATELRTAHLNADKAKARFFARNDELSTKMKAQPSVYADTITRLAYMAQDVERRDALGDYNFWREEECRVALVIQAEHALRQMLILDLA